MENVKLIYKYILYSFHLHITLFYNVNFVQIDLLEGLLHDHSIAIG